MPWERGKGEKQMQQAVMLWYIDRSLLIDKWKKEQGQKGDTFWHRPCPFLNTVTIFSQQDLILLDKLKPNQRGQYLAGIAFRKQGYNNLVGSIMWPKELTNAARETQNQTDNRGNTDSSGNRIGVGFGHDW